MKQFLLIFVVLLVTGCGRGYSNGERSGRIYKLSKKGFFCKSWEGEMTLGGIRRTDDGQPTANVWAFSVLDESVVRKVQEAERSGKPVVAKYVQWAVAGPCTMETDYELVDIEPGGEAKPE